MDPWVLDKFDRSAAAWYETEEEVRQGVRWGKRKAELLRWVRRHMEGRLTARERRCLELYYFRGMSYQELGEATGTHASSAFRAVKRSVRKLQQAAIEDPSWRRPSRTRRRRP